MGCVAALFLLVVAAEPSLPVICVDAPAAMADDVVEAMRVRLDRRQLRVATCASVDGDSAWRVTVRPAADDVLPLAVDGETTWAHELDIHGLRSVEISRIVALHVVEAVRPSVDAALVRLGLTPEPVPEPVGAPVDAPRLAFDARAGVVLGAAPFHAAAQLQLDAVVKQETLRFTGGVGLRTMSRAERSAVSASGGELHLELAARKSWEVVELGVHARGRATRIALASDNPNVRDGARTYWDTGLGASSIIWPFRAGRLAFGLVIAATVWARPHQLDVEGQELLRQSRVDLFAGPILELQP